MVASPSSVINPFRDSIHSNPWIDPKSDVKEIGREAFEMFQRELLAVRRAHLSRSLLIFGEPGCGKTHLIARIRMFLAGLSRRHWLDNVFVSVQMHTAPSRIWRHIRYRLMEDLLRPLSGARSQMNSLLFRILAAQGSSGPYLDDLKNAFQSEADQHESLPLAHALFAAFNHLDMSGELQQLYSELVHHLDGEESLPPALRAVLLHLILRRHLGIAYGWLRGDSLPDSDLETLGVPRPDDEDPEGEAREFVLNILRLIGAGTPVVFCFDQTEALQSAPGDISGLFAFGNAVSALHDLSTNALLLSFVQSIFVGALKGALGSHFDRLTEKQVALPMLTRAQATPLIHARMADLSVAQSARIKPEDFDELFASNGLATPRQIIARASHLYDRKSDETLQEFMAERWEIFLENSERACPAAMADEILEHGLPILLRLGGGKSKINAKPDADFRDVQIKFSGPTGVRGVSICNQENMNSLSARFRRLKSGPLAAERLVLVRDARLPIRRTAKKTLEQLEELTSAGARIVRTSPETLAALDALRTLITTATSGDLAHNGNAVAPRTVEEWLAQRLPPALSQLSDDLTGGSSKSDVVLGERLIECLGVHLLMTLPEAAAATDSSEAEVTAFASANPQIAGYLAGPPCLLFQRAGEGDI